MLAESASVTTPVTEPPPPSTGDLASLEPLSPWPDRLLRWASRGSSLTVLAILAAIAVFLVSKALPAISKDTASFFTTKDWLPDQVPVVFGVAALVCGTLISSLIALVIAVPIAIGVALFLTQYAPKRLASPLGYVVDLLAAVPSVVFGLWGIRYLNNAIKPVSMWLHTHLGFIPLFGDTGERYGRSLFLAGVVLAIMILPIISALAREIMLQTPQPAMEAALGLGATRWEVIRMVVLPFSRPGIISSIMLGLGRAFGETIAVALVLAANFEITAKILGPGGNTIAANIATKFGESGPTGRGALIASGLVLFAITLAVNVGARAVVARNGRAVT